MGAGKDFVKYVLGGALDSVQGVANRYQEKQSKKEDFMQDLIKLAIAKQLEIAANQSDPMRQLQAQNLRNQISAFRTPEQEQQMYIERARASREPPKTLDEIMAESKARAEGTAAGTPVKEKAPPSLMDWISKSRLNEPPAKPVPGLGWLGVKSGGWDEEKAQKATETYIKIKKAAQAAGIPFNEAVDRVLGAGASKMLDEETE